MRTHKHKRALAKKLKTKQIVDFEISLDGKFNTEHPDMEVTEEMKFKPIVSNDRPHIYFFKMLDCSKSIAEKFGNQAPRIRSKWIIKSKDSYDYAAEDDNWSHFTYED